MKLSELLVEFHDFFRIFSMSMTLFCLLSMTFFFLTFHDKISPPCFYMTVGTLPMTVCPDSLNNHPSFRTSVFLRFKQNVSTFDKTKGDYLLENVAVFV